MIEIVSSMKAIEYSTGLEIKRIIDQQMFGSIYGNKENVKLIIMSWLKVEESRSKL